MGCGGFLRWVLPTFPKTYGSSLPFVALLISEDRAGGSETLRWSFGQPD